MRILLFGLVFGVFAVTSIWYMYEASKSQAEKEFVDSIQHIVKTGDYNDVLSTEKAYIEAVRANLGTFVDYDVVDNGTGYVGEVNTSSIRPDKIFIVSFTDMDLRVGAVYRDGQYFWVTTSTHKIN